MSSITKLRDALEEFLGKERFEKFVACGVRPRLLFWQEADLAKFIEANPNFKESLDDLEVALNICQLHRFELLVDRVEVFHGNIDYSDRYIKAKRTLFPHEAMGPVSTEGVPSDETSVQVLYCPKCREACSAWCAERA